MFSFHALTCLEFILQNACIDTVCVTLLDAKWSKNILFSWQGDCCSKEDMSRRQSRDEESEEDSEGLRSQQIDSSKGLGMGKVHQRPNWSLFIKVLLKF